jgi:hypothetical protein
MSNRWFKTYEDDIRLLLKDSTALQIYYWVRLNVDDDGTMTTGRNKAAEALDMEPKTFQKALHERLCKRWGILEAAPSSNGKFTVIKFKNWDKYRPFYQNHQHGSTKTGHLSTIMVPQYDEASIDTPVPQKPISVPPSSSTIQNADSSTKNSLEINTSVPQSGNDLVPQKSSTVLEEYKKNLEEEKINNTSPNGEVRRLAAELFGSDEVHVESREETIEGEVVQLGKDGKPLKRGQNVDGSFGNADINEGMKLLADLLGEKPIKGELNRRALRNLYRKRGKEATLERIQDAFDVRSDRYAPKIVNYMDLWDKWEDLKLYFERKRPGVRIGVVSADATYDNVAGGVAW